MKPKEQIWVRALARPRHGSRRWHRQAEHMRRIEEITSDLNFDADIRVLAAAREAEMAAQIRLRTEEDAALAEGRLAYEAGEYDHHQFPKK
jgi:hypothetical protein